MIPFDKISLSNDDLDGIRNMTNLSNKEVENFDPAVDTVAQEDPFKELREMIKATKGRIMQVTFIKKNGELRKMRCRIGVKKNINPNARKCFNGTTNTKAHIPKYINVYEMGVGDRTLNLETLKYMKCSKIKFQVEDDNGV